NRQMHETGIDSLQCWSICAIVLLPLVLFLLIMRMARQPVHHITLPAESTCADIRGPIGLWRQTEETDRLRVFQEAVQPIPTSAGHWFLLGCATFRRQRFGDSASAFERASDLNPQMASARLLHQVAKAANDEIGAAPPTPRDAQLPPPNTTRL